LETTICGGGDPITGYVPIDQIRYTIGTQIFQDTTLSTPFANGWYRDGDDKLQIVSGAVVNIKFCSSSH